jgi:hypothetical protein
MYIHCRSNGATHTGLLEEVEVATFKRKSFFDDCTVINESNMAILVQCPFWTSPRWLPKSQIDEESECQERNDVGVLVTSAWIAEEKHLSGAVEK